MVALLNEERRRRVTSLWCDGDGVTDRSRVVVEVTPRLWHRGEVCQPCMSSKVVMHGPPRSGEGDVRGINNAISPLFSV